LHHLHAKNFVINELPSFLAGLAGVEPAVTVLETVGLPLTDRPKITFFFLCAILCFGG
jgi:hypothetical protein